MAALKFLVIAPQPFFQPRGTPFSVYYRTLVLAEQGADIDLLAYGEGANVDIPRTRIVRIPRIRMLEPVPIGPSWKKLFLDFFMILWTIGLLMRHRYQVVHAHEESVFWCRFLRPVFRFRLVYDMHSSLPQQLGNFRFSHSKWLVGIFRALEDTCLRASNAVITICPDLRDYALAAGVQPARHLLIENSIFDDVRLRNAPPETGPTADQAGEAALAAIDPRRPLVLYAGTLEPYQGVDMVIEAFASVMREMPDVQLVLLGGTAEQVTQMRALAERLGVACTFTGQVSKTLAMRFTKVATVLLSSRRNGTNTPLKVYEQLASGKPLVATRIWSHTQVLTDDVCVLVEPDGRSMAEGVLRVVRDAELSARLTANARALYEREYSRPIYEEKIRRLLELLALPVGSRQNAHEADADASALADGGLLEFTHDAIIIWEMDGEGILYWNRAAEQLYGYSRAEAHGKVTHTLLKTQLAGTVSDLEAKLARYGVWIGELRHTKRDGRQVEVEGQLALMSQRNGRWLVLEVNRDVTDRKRAETLRLAMEKRLEAIRYDGNPVRSRASS